MNIVEQYIRFAHIYDACVEEDKRNGKEKPDEATVVKSIDICLNEGVLTKFLTEHRLEVVSIMTTLFDEDYLREVDRREAYLEGKAEGEARGEARGEANATRRFLELLESGKTKEEILATYSF